MQTCPPTTPHQNPGYPRSGSTVRYLPSIRRPSDDALSRERACLTNAQIVIPVKSVLNDIVHPHHRHDVEAHFLCSPASRDPSIGTTIRSRDRKKLSGRGDFRVGVLFRASGRLAGLKNSRPKTLQSRDLKPIVPSVIGHPATRPPQAS
jgi:hypothetical protein